MNPIELNQLNWNRLVSELSPSLYRYFSTSFPLRLAEECVQETLLRLVQKIEGGHYNSERGSLRMYSYGIAHFVKLEAQRNNPRSNEPEVIHTLAHEYSNPHHDLEQKQALLALRRAILQLSELQSHIFRAKENLKIFLSSSMEVIK